MKRIEELEKENILPTDEEPIKVICRNCLEVMKGIPDESIDLVLTDPPYNLNRFKDNDNKTDVEFIEFSLEWLNECYRVLKENKLLFFTFWADGMYEMYNIIKQTKFNFIQTLIWYYPNISGFKGKPQYTRTFDPIFVLSKSKPRKLNIQKGAGFGTADCWNMLKICKPQSNYKMDKLVHPTQKPKELFKKIIMENSNEQDLILDPFCGVGTFLYGLENRKGIGIEINPDYYKIAKSKLKDLK